MTDDNSQAESGRLEKSVDIVYSPDQDLLRRLPLELLIDFVDLFR